MTLARRIAVAICFLLLLSLMVVFTLCYFLLPAEFGALLREYMGLLLQIGLAVMLVAALLVWRLCLHQFGPLTTLVALMNTVRDRPRLDSDVLPGDEIAALFKSFNQLVDELRVHRQAMSALVVEGSAEMADANQEMQAMNQMLEDTNRHLLQENRARRESEDRLRRRERQYRAISGLLAWADGRNVFEMILQSAVQLLGANNGFIGLFDEEKQKFHIQHGIGIDAELIGEALPARIGLKWQVHASGELMYVEDYRRYTGRLENEKLEAIISVVMLPLKVDGIVRGILGISWIDDVHFIEADDLGALRQFGDLASVALER
ncbi:MAG: GAF domain-containing protein, partial [Selenomonadaceae bacterium]